MGIKTSYMYLDSRIVICNAQINWSQMERDEWFYEIIKHRLFYTQTSNIYP